MRRQMRRQRAEISTRIFWRRGNCEISLRTILFLTLAVGCATLATADTKPHTKPDLGPNVLIFDPAMPQAAAQQQIDNIYAVERGNEFGPERYALLFLPGEYHLDVPVGFYTQVLGLGASPDCPRQAHTRVPAAPPACQIAFPARTPDR